MISPDAADDTVAIRGRDLFLVNSSVSAWIGLPYLEERVAIARAFDIAAGSFQIGSLLSLDGKWQPIAKIRILMGAETKHRKALLDAVSQQAVSVLEHSIEADKNTNPFLKCVPAIVEAHLRARHRPVPKDRLGPRLNHRHEGGRRGHRPPRRLARGVKGFLQ